jgi:hypothetical protein
MSQDLAAIILLVVIFGIIIGTGVIYKTRD